MAYRNLIGISAVALAFSLPGMARADVIFAPTSYARAEGFFAFGDVYGVSIRNGTQEEHIGAVGVVSGNALHNSASANTGQATSNASANLADGTLHANGSSVPNAGSFSFAELADTLYFNNASGGVVGLDVRFAVDGSIITSADNVFPGGFGSLTLTGPGVQLGAFGAPVIQASNTEYLVFNKDGMSVAESTTASGPPAGGSYDYGTTFNAGAVTGFLQTTVYLPTGLSTLGVRTQLSLDCRLGAVCDFGHTAGLTFGPIADGLSFTSESGGFMSALAAGPDAGVPEPASWATMILGFGAAGAMIRRRRVAAIA